MVAPSRRLDLPSDVGRKLHLDPAGQRGFPLDQLPLPTPVTVLPRLDERALELDLGTQQMPPLVPGGIPNDWHGRLVERDFKFPANIAVDGVIAIEVKPAQRCVEAAVALFRQERQNTRGEERLTIARAVSCH